MRKRLFYWFASVLLVISVVLVVWQGSFRLWKFGPSNAGQTFIFWAVSTLIFILMVTVGWILAREFIKLYVARQAKRLGSRIRTKLVVGAMLLSCVPVSFLVLWSYEVLNYNLKAWFTNPVDNQVEVYKRAARALDLEIQTRLARTGRAPGRAAGDRAAAGRRRRHTGRVAAIRPMAGPGIRRHPRPRRVCPSKPGDRTRHGRATARPPWSACRCATAPSKCPHGSHWMPGNNCSEIKKFSDEWAQIAGNRKDYRTLYIMLMVLITLFVLFVATWLARILANRISTPIAAILEAAGEVRRGNLKHRVTVRAEDELALLVSGFNQMTEALESSGSELDRRRRFTEAILESIPTGVISIASDGSIQHVNRALAKIFPGEEAARATRLEDLFSREDTTELKYLMKRARRTGVASRQLELRTDRRKIHLAVTVAALESKLTSGFVMVLEDTSELLRAQKAAAWHEVARRVAHEIKNPLTPIALSAERIGRQLDRLELPPGTARIVYECAATITKSVESVKTLVDEFSQFARFPSAQPVRCDLNEVVSEALLVFHGRLEGISIRTSFAPNLPPVNVDREQFQRVVVNLVDNAAEAMQEALVKTLYIATQAGAAETVEVVVADSGAGVSSDDKERLFLPYFSTKNRGTGLGLAIVNHIVAEHNGTIRVEDNQPVGARFTVELPAVVENETAAPAPDADVRASVVKL